jgi:hypothetical protein
VSERLVSDENGDGGARSRPGQVAAGDAVRLAEAAADDEGVGKAGTKRAKTTVSIDRMAPSGFAPYILGMPECPTDAI